MARVNQERVLLERLFRVAVAAVEPGKLVRERLGTSKLGDTPMLHVWTIPNPCGPFAALEGIGAGQVPVGQTRNCDTRNASVP